MTEEDPTLQTLWQYALRFRIEELFLDSKSGAFQLEESRIRHPKALERLYLVVALALLFATAHGMTVKLKGLRNSGRSSLGEGFKLSQNWCQVAQRNFR